MVKIVHVCITKRFYFVEKVQISVPFYDNNNDDIILMQQQLTILD